MRTDANEACSVGWKEGGEDRDKLASGFEANREIFQWPVWASKGGLVAQSASRDGSTWARRQRHPVLLGSGPRRDLQGGNDQPRAGLS